MIKENKKVKPPSPWEHLSEFVTSLKADIEASSPTTDTFPHVAEEWLSGDLMFTRVDLGGLILNGAVADKYRECISRVYDFVAGKRGQISRRAGENFIQ